MLLLDIANSVARSGFRKLVLFGSHGGNVGAIDDFFRDLHIETGMRVFKVFAGSIGSVPGLIDASESAIAMHAGDSETSVVRYLAPELVHMERAEGFVYDTDPLIGYSFKGHDVIEAWVTSDLAPTGAIGNPHLSSPEKGQALFEASVARLAQLLEAVYHAPPREVRPAPTATGATV
jgi:creatinine amidohydrolase